MNIVLESIFNLYEDSLRLFVFLQVKVMTDRDLLAIACEQFLGKSVTEIKAVVIQTLEGHLRSILGEAMEHFIYYQADV